MTLSGAVITTIDSVIRVATLSLCNRSVTIGVPPEVDLICCGRHVGAATSGVVNLMIAAGLRV